MGDSVTSDAAFLNEIQIGIKHCINDIRQLTDLDRWGLLGVPTWTGGACWVLLDVVGRCWHVTDLDRWGLLGVVGQH